MRSTCAAGQLDCHLGCSAEPVDMGPVYDRRAPCDPPDVERAPFLDRPALLDGVRDVVSLAASAHQTCVVRSDGVVACWGAIR
jgi:hypothetical protein